MANDRIEEIEGQTSSNVCIEYYTLTLLFVERGRVRVLSRPTQYAHTGDFTMGAARKKPSAYYRVCARYNVNSQGAITWSLLQGRHA